MKNLMEYKFYYVKIIHTLNTRKNMKLKKGLLGRFTSSQGWDARHESWIPAYETVSQFLFCHSVQAKRDTESSIIMFWIPAFAGMTTFIVIRAIATQSVRRNDKGTWTPACAGVPAGVRYLPLLDMTRFY
jgi:hypothetical protein